VIGNERLTALAGAVLLVLFAVETMTVVDLGALIWVHFFVGVLLVGPLAVKTASTGWRFLRYYTHSPVYRRKGPPGPMLRVLAPLLVASTVALIGSGLALAATGPAPPVLLQIHMLSFLVWLATIIVHTAAYLAREPQLLRQDWARASESEPSTTAPGRWARLAANVGALAAAGVAAVILLSSAAPWSGWVGGGITKVGIVAVVLILSAIVAAALRRRARRRRA
jgi:hypothetical protein